MDNYMLVPFYGELYVFYFMSAIICIWILYVLSHDVSNALLHHVTPNYRKSIILGKQEVIPRNKSQHVW